MRKKLFLILISICALSIVTLISASILYTFSISMNSSVAVQGTVTVRIDGTDYANGAPITVNWGSVGWGANNKSITITNNANTALTPHLTVSGLPASWTLAFSLEGQSIATNNAATGTLTLNVPTGAASGTQSWSASLTVEY